MCNCDDFDEYFYLWYNTTEEEKERTKARWEYILWQHKQADKIIQKLIEKIKSGGKHGQI